MENNTQKALKISLSSSASSEDLSDCSIDFEHTPCISPSADKISGLISSIQLALMRGGVLVKSGPDCISTLETLVSTICTEYLKSTVELLDTSSRMSSENSFFQKSFEKNTEFSQNILEKIVECPDTGLKITQVECNTITSLLVGLLRDTPSDESFRKIEKLEKTLVNCGKTINQLRLDLKEKDFLISSLKTGAKSPTPKKKRFFSKKAKNMESESTLNESEDTIF